MCPTLHHGSIMETVMEQFHWIASEAPALLPATGWHHAVTLHKARVAEHRARDLHILAVSKQFGR